MAISTHPAYSPYALDADAIAALYHASQAGVLIDLLVRGICCLRPGIDGLIGNIRVHTVIDRFLEHARIFHFKNGGADVFCSSADWMPRNFRRRVEVMFPVLDDVLKQRLIDEILGTMRADTAKAWLLRAGGQYERLPDCESGLRSQHRFMELARERRREPEPIRGLASKPLTMPPPPLERLRQQAEKKRKKRRRDE